MPQKVEIQNSSGLWVPQASTQKLCEHLFRYFHKNKKVKLALKGLYDAPLRVIFVDKKQGKRLNKTHRNKNYPTDVLSFGSGEPQMGLGELILCVPILRQQAKEHKLSLTKETQYLVIHGFLHLLGYEHETNPRDEKRMMALQDQLFERYVLGERK